MGRKAVGTLCYAEDDPVSRSLTPRCPVPRWFTVGRRGAGWRLGAPRGAGLMTGARKQRAVADAVGSRLNNQDQPADNSRSPQ